MSEEEWIDVPKPKNWNERHARVVKKRVEQPRQGEIWKYISTVEDVYFAVTISKVHKDMVAYHWVDANDYLLSCTKFIKEFTECFAIALRIAENDVG